MSKSFFEWLDETAKTRDSLLCVGLDPRVGDANALRAECFRLIDATAEFAAAFKANSAFFEVFGAEGFAALRDVIAHVPPDIPVILDAKRGDIADTSEAYARAAFDYLGAHAITISPYLGRDAIAPFLARPERGAFLLCKTSNPGADEFQSLETPEGALFQVVAEHAQAWNARANLGLVVGATDPAALARVRAAAPDRWFLVPGVGTQGGDLAAALAAGLRADGLGMLINVSRAIASAPDPRAEAKRLRDEINRHRERPVRFAKPDRSLLARDLIDSACIRFGQFTLKSGQVSPIYLDLRQLVAHPKILRRVARAYARKLRELKFDRLAGIPYAALPIATAIALEMDRPLIYPRREAKEYGTRASIEGKFAPGETVVVVDDLATTGGSKIETIEKLTSAGLIVRDVVVLIDREQGARASLAAAGYALHAIVTLRELLDEMRRSGAITPEQFAQVTAYLGSEKK
ncbi:MAG: orotidine-5'-phosphate decarboxylase [Chloroflexota bacterium]